jgi:uncharacterized protein
MIMNLKSDKMAKRHSRGVLLAVFIAGMLMGGGVALYVASVFLYQPVPGGVQVPPPSSAPLPPHSAAVRIVAVSTATNEGIVGTATVEIVPGHGRVLVSANPFIEPDTQESVTIAKAVAENFTGVSLGGNDIIASFDLPFNDTQPQLIGGPSAGAALAVALTAALQNASVRPDAAIIGRILPDGTIGAVGAVLEKAKAAGEAGMALFLVPAGQADVVYYEKVEERTVRNGLRITRVSYVPKTLELNDYTQQWNMTAVEVATLAEAAGLAIVG